MGSGGREGGREGGKEGVRERARGREGESELFYRNAKGPVLLPNFWVFLRRVG